MSVAAINTKNRGEGGVGNRSRLGKKAGLYTAKTLHSHSESMAKSN